MLQILIFFADDSACGQSLTPLFSSLKGARPGTYSSISHTFFCLSEVGRPSISYNWVKSRKIAGFEAWSGRAYSVLHCCCLLEACLLTPWVRPCCLSQKLAQIANIVFPQNAEIPIVFRQQNCLPGILAFPSKTTNSKAKEQHQLRCMSTVRRLTSTLNHIHQNTGKNMQKRRPRSEKGTRREFWWNPETCFSTLNF